MYSTIYTHTHTHRARPPSDCYTSTNSLDDILVAPPDMFNEPSETTQTTAHEIVGHVTKGSNHIIARIIPSSPSHDNHVTSADRHSTESNDTGYTSGPSPGVQQIQGVELGEFQLEFKDTNSITSEDAIKVIDNNY